MKAGSNLIFSCIQVRKNSPCVTRLSVTDREITYTLFLSILHWGFPGGSDGKESACNEGNLGSIPELGRSPGGGHGNALKWVETLLSRESPWTEEPGELQSMGSQRVGHD